jgi:hypothetical protein
VASALARAVVDVCTVFASPAFLFVIPAFR